MPADPRLTQILLTAESLETDARAMRSGAWQRSMNAGAAAIRELVGAVEAARLEGRREGLAASVAVCESPDTACAAVNISWDGGRASCARAITAIDPLTIGSEP